LYAQQLGFIQWRKYFPFSFWWQDAFLLLDLSLDIGEGDRALDLKGDDIVSRGLNEDLHNENTSKKKQFKPICATKQT